MGARAERRRRARHRVRPHPAARRARRSAPRVRERARVDPAEVPRRRADHVGHRARRDGDRRHADEDGRRHGHGRRARDPSTRRSARTRRPASSRARLAKLGADAVREGLPRYVRGELAPTPQDHAHATTAPLLEKETGRIDWSKPAAPSPRPRARHEPVASAPSRLLEKGTRVIVHRTKKSPR